jgi:adenine-specific DNA methylase
MKIIDRIPRELLDAVNEFSKELEWARRIPVYEVHKWWARRYSGIVRLFLAFTELDLRLLEKVTDFSSFVRNLYLNPPKVKNKKLLDPFAGGGTILVESSILGYESFGIEINKLPCLVLDSLKILSNVDLEIFEHNIKSISNYLLNMWSTKCTNGHNALIIHTFLAWKNRRKELQIKFNKIKDGKVKFYFCERCGKIYTSKAELSRCMFCGNEFNKSYIKVEYFKLSPYALEYYCPTCRERSIKKITLKDLNNFRQKISYNSLEIPKLNETARLLNAGFRDFGQLLTPRQLLTFKIFLSHFQTEPYKTLAKVLVSDALRSCSILAYFSNMYTKVIPAFAIKSYWLPPQPVELNPLAYRCLSGKFLPLGRGNVISAFRKLKRARDFIVQQKIEFRYKILHGPAQDILPQIKETFNVIFTDPPYGNYQFYSDLSLLNLSIIGEINEQSLAELLLKEIILRHKKDLIKYKNGLYEIFHQAVNRLSDNGKLLVTFHHPDENLLYAFLDVFKNLPVRLHAVYPVIGESSGNLIKRKIYLDLIFVFGKQKRDVYHTLTMYKLTKYDENLQNSIGKLIEFYEE